MLCVLKVRRSQASGEDESPYELQITSRHAVGGAGGRFSDEVSYPSLPELMQALHDLQLPGALVSATNATTALEEAGSRWLPIATDIQITFDALTAAGFHLDAEGG